MKNKESTLKFVLFLLLGYALFTLFYHLDADPSPLKRLGDYADEGYWVQNAINKIHFGHFIVDDYNVAFFGAPLYNISYYILFNIFGISFFSVRLFPVCLLVFLTFIQFLLWRKFEFSTGKAFLYAVLFLLLHDNQMQFRWSTPVQLEMVFQMLLIYFLIANKLTSVKNALYSVLIFLLAYFSKSTSIWMILFLSIVFFMDNASQFSKKKSGYIRNLLLYMMLLSAPCYMFMKFNDSVYHQPYSLFRELLFSNTSMIVHSYLHFLNPVFIVKNIVTIFKFPNATVLFLPIVYASYICLKKLPAVKQFFRDFKSNKIRQLVLYYTTYRSFAILLLFVSLSVLFLLFTDLIQYDRRITHLMNPFYILSVLIIEKSNIFEWKSFRDRALIFSVLFIILVFQTKNLFFYFHIKNILSNETAYYLLIACCSMTSAFIYVFFWNRKWMIASYIILNMLLNLMFLIHDNYTLLEASKKIAALSERYHFKESTGFYAHHLSIGTRVFPVRWISPEKKFPAWNAEHQFLKNNQCFLLISDKKLNADNGYYSLEKHSKEKTKILKQDTLFLYKNFSGNAYEDTLIVRVIQKD